MRLSFKTRREGAQRRASCARTLAKPGSKLNRATTGEAGPTKGPGSAAEPRRGQPTSRAQRASHANRARLRREEEPREAERRTSANAEFVDEVARENVRLTVAALSQRSDVLRELLTAGEIAIVGAMYDVATGQVEFLGAASA